MAYVRAHKRPMTTHENSFYTLSLARADPLLDLSIRVLAVVAAADDEAERRGFR